MTNIGAIDDVSAEEPEWATESIADVIRCRDAHETFVGEIFIGLLDVTDAIDDVATRIAHFELEPNLALLAESRRNAMSRADVFDAHGQSQ